MLNTLAVIGKLTNKREIWIGLMNILLAALDFIQEAQHDVRSVRDDFVHIFVLLDHQNKQLMQCPLGLTSADIRLTSMACKTAIASGTLCLSPSSVSELALSISTRPSASGLATVNDSKDTSLRPSQCQCHFLSACRWKGEDEEGS